jgi:hypothetical protein
VDAAFWAEQQKIAIPGWLQEDQKERLHQEGHFESIKQPRSPTTKENEAKKEFLAVGEGVQDGGPCHTPSPPVATFGPEPASFQENSRVIKTRRWVLVTNPQNELVYLLARKDHKITMA